jgi:hypothetical protein
LPVQRIGFQCPGNVFLSIAEYVKVAWQHPGSGIAFIIAGNNVAVNYY